MEYFNFRTRICRWVDFEKMIFPITLLGSLVPGIRNICNQLLLLVNQGFAFLAAIPATITFGKLPGAVGVLIILMMFLIEITIIGLQNGQLLECFIWEAGFGSPFRLSRRLFILISVRGMQP